MLEPVMMGKKKFAPNTNADDKKLIEYLQAKVVELEARNNQVRHLLDEARQKRDRYSQGLDQANENTETAKKAFNNVIDILQAIHLEVDALGYDLYIEGKLQEIPRE
jgi:hypothetical protein